MTFRVMLPRVVSCAAVEVLDHCAISVHVTCASLAAGIYRCQVDVNGGLRSMIKRRASKVRWRCAQGGEEARLSLRLGRGRVDKSTGMEGEHPWNNPHHTALQLAFFWARDSRRVTATATAHRFVPFQSFPSTPLTGRCRWRSATSSPHHPTSHRLGFLSFHRHHRALYWRRIPL